MGRRDRERRQRIEAGEQSPIAQPKEGEVLVCEKCRAKVTTINARDHIRSCWGMQISDTAPIPRHVPKQYMGGLTVVRTDNVQQDESKV